MSENGTVAATEETTSTTAEPTNQETAETAEQNTEDISYHTVEKEGNVTAIWEMQGRKHLRTIDPRSHQGQDILRLYTSEHHDEASAATTESTGT